MRHGLRLLVAVSVLTALLFGYAHLALASHAVCAAHGEVVDATPGGAPQAGDLVASPRASRLHIADDGPAIDHGDGQCAVLALLSASFMLRLAPGDAAAGPQTSRALADAGAGHAPTRLQLLLAAPKASPPV